MINHGIVISRMRYVSEGRTDVYHSILMTVKYDMFHVNHDQLTKTCSMFIMVGQFIVVCHDLP